MICSFDYATEPLGTLTVASDDEGLVGLWLDGQKYFGARMADELGRADASPILDEARRWLDRYFAGERPDPSELPLAPRGTDFQKRVWRELAAIPYGELTTYGAIAKRLEAETGKRASARAVGVAVGHNPISIILPCHRVVGSTGSLTGYAGGIERKLWLLNHEGVDTTCLSVPTRGTAL